ncbi:MAG: ankyrin repeat domain-containing protein [Odoribacter sp.]|nr:ankyrin repeat domain-containing protein [Odoribacter sp.]
MTALMYLATQRPYKGVENNVPLMLEYGADTTLKDKDGNTVLMHLAQNKDFNWTHVMADLLFEFSDPLPQETNNEGKTALDYAVENNNEKLVKLLLEKM